MIHIVFENNFFVICDKESGVLSTPSRFEDSDERRCLGTELQAQLGVQIYPVHRLDFEVSGLVMYAKTAEAHKKANAWFEHKQVQKTYRALTRATQNYSHIPPGVANAKVVIDLKEETEFLWRSKLLRGKRRAYENPLGKDSLTIAKFLKINEQGIAEWDLNPVTGRPHQLRFELSRHGFPILGDNLYGSEMDLGENQLSLRSYKIDFSKAPGALQLGLDILEVAP